MIPLNARDYLAPRYWPLWLAFGLLRLMSALPIRWTQAIGSGLGMLFYRLVPSRRRVARINIRQAYPDYSEEQVRALIRLRNVQPDRQGAEKGSHRAATVSTSTLEFCEYHGPL